jgi:hypothetical protein
MYVLVLLTCMLALSQAFNLTDLSNQTAIYEKISTVRTISSTWKIWTHVNTKEFYADTKSMKASLDDYQKLCNAKSLEGKLGTCEINMEILRAKLNEIFIINSFLQNSLSVESRRKKRSWFGAVGQISKHLFGTLTEEDATFFDSQVNKLEKNEQSISDSVNKQITFLNSLYKLNNDSNSSLKSHLSKFQDQIDNLDQDLNTIAVHGNETLIRQRLSEIFILGLHAMNEYHTRQEKLYSTLINPGHVLSPNLLDPEILLNELRKIRLSLPIDLSLPFEDTKANIFKFYHLMTVTLASHGSHIVFEISLPLLSHMTYDLFQVTGIPSKTKNNTYSIPSLEANFLAIDKTRENYFSPTPQEIALCTSITNILFCQNHKKALNTNSNSCLLQLFFNIGHSNACHEKYFKISKEKWIQLATPNSWLYVLPDLTKVTFLCNQTETMYLQGSGKVSATDDCRIKTDHTILYPHAFFKSENSHTFHISGNRINLTESGENMLDFIPQLTHEKNHDPEYSKFAYSMPELRKISLLKIQRYPHGNVIIGLSATAMFLILCALVIFICLKCRKNPQKTENPLELKETTREPNPKISKKVTFPSPTLECPNFPPPTPLINETHQAFFIGNPTPSNPPSPLSCPTTHPHPIFSRPSRTYH